MLRSACALAWLICLTAGCASSEERGEPSGATCDPALTYSADVAPIVERTCSACHSARVPLTERHGAPGDIHFDDETKLIALAQRIDARAGVGPDAQNRSMPPDGFRKPSDDERDALARFLACFGESAPHHHH